METECAVLRMVDGRLWVGKVGSNEKKLERERVGSVATCFAVALWAFASE